MGPEEVTSPEALAKVAAEAMWNANLIGASQIQAAADLIAMYTRDAMQVERERCARVSRVAAAGIAGSVNDQTIEAVFDLPERILKGE